MRKPEKRYPQVEGKLIENNKGHRVLHSGNEGIVISRNQLSRNSKHTISNIFSASKWNHDTK